MAIQVKRKTLSRTGWAQALSSSFTWQEASFPAFPAVVSLHQLHRVRAPLVSTAFPEKVVVADDGYSWLQIAPAGQHWWLSAMFDPAGNIVQFYLDVTRENVLRGADSFFDDLFLDIVALPDGRAALLDEADLSAALAAGQITPADAALARSTARHLLTDLPRQAEHLRTCCQRLRATLLAAPEKKFSPSP